MKTLMFAVRDKQAEAFLPPFFARARGEAVRMFMSAVEDPQHQFSKHSGDFDLFLIGEFEDTNGEFVPNPGGTLKIFGGLDVNVEK